MTREIQEPYRTDRKGLHDDDGPEERHPAWGLIGASRVSCGPPGAVLFDSELRHGHTIRVRLSAASRRRTLNRDYLGSEEQYFEVEMSEAQWASFVSSMNTGNGVPCTVRYRRDGALLQVPEMPYAPRMKESLEEVRTAATRAVGKVRAAFEAYKERKNAGNLRHLQAMIDNLPSNLEFAGRSLAQHAENTVQKARADLEAMVRDEAQRRGLDAGDVGITLELEAPEEEALMVPRGCSSCDEVAKRLTRVGEVSVLAEAQDA